MYEDASFHALFSNRYVDEDGAISLLKATRALHASGRLTRRRADHPMNIAVQRHLKLRDMVDRRRKESGLCMNSQAVHGTPITPRHLLPQIAGGSFCVSYFNPEQLDDVIPLLDVDSILMLDNGAYSAWQKGIEFDEAYWDRYWAWALPVLDAIPQAVAVIPDVIGGSVAENRHLWTQLPDAVFGRECQMMGVWHLSEPLEVIEDMMASGIGRIGFGSDGEYRAVGSPRWRERIKQAFDYIDSLVGDGLQGYFRPRVHLMRGLGQMVFGEFPFDSADSTNIARNHSRLKGTSDEENRVAVMRARIEAGAFPIPSCAMWPRCSWEPVLQAGDAPRERPLQQDLFAL